MQKGPKSPAIKITELQTFKNLHQKNILGYFNTQRVSI